MSKKSNSSSGIGFFGALFLVFLVLKLTEVIDWSWWWVTAPMWGGLALFVLIMFIVLIYTIATTPFKMITILCLLSASLSAQNDSTLTPIEKPAESAIKIYPNPFKDQVTIETERGITYEAVDSNGKIVDLKQASPGQYLIVFTDRKKKYLKRVIKE